MLVLIDYSGSMTIERFRGDGTSAGTRFEAAQSLAIDQVNFYNGMTTLGGVAVYTFNSSNPEPVAVTNDGAGSPYISATDAIIAIGNIPDPVPGPATPLGDAICKSAEFLRAVGTPTNTRILHISTDGGENSSDVAVCGGTDSVDPNEPFDPGSWQNKAYDAIYPLTPASDITVVVNLFQEDTIVNPTLARKASAFAASSPLENAVAPLRAKAAAAIAQLTDRVFFAKLTARNGGGLNVVEDAQELPVAGDVGGDGCVDLVDAIDVVRNFGRPATAKFDLNLDGKIGYLDFLAAIGQVDGTCGVRDVTTPIAPIRCNAGRVTLDKKSITTTGIAIDIAGACDLTIKNSRIVTGRDAIRIRGSARLTIENSVIAGERAFLVLTGASRVSALNTIFRGVREITGALLIEDRGGNDWGDQPLSKRERLR